MQFTLLAAVVLALAQVQVHASPISREGAARTATYMTYATEYYVDPWVVMQGERAASTASTVAVGATPTLSPEGATRTATYMTYATDYYVDPWVVMQGQRAASTASTVAIGATEVAQSAVSTATDASTVTSSSTDTSSSTVSTSSTATAFVPAVTDVVDFATDEYAYPNGMYTARSMTRGQPAPTSSEEEQYYHAQTQRA
ncbi:hypothetical protein AURDEDRAFT_179804 [Auricularia subglabra TFB-10046 SS5]|nr:hypothetical protein AURDEDRAFT_179804 [Auricularia subglabra TFB-10046 SS5]